GAARPVPGFGQSRPVGGGRRGPPRADWRRAGPGGRARHDGGLRSRAGGTQLAGLTLVFRCEPARRLRQSGRGRMSSYSRGLVMKRLAMPLALALTLPALGSLSAQPGKEDAKNIQGTWDQVAYEKDGNKTATPNELKLKIGPDMIEPVGKDLVPFRYKI